MERFLAACCWFGFVMYLLFAGAAIHMGWEFESRVMLVLGIFFGWQTLMTSVASRHERERLDTPAPQ